VGAPGVIVGAFVGAFVVGVLFVGASHAALVSDVLKHSHLGATIPFSFKKSQLQSPRPAQLTGQNISGHALVNLGQVMVVPLDASCQSMLIVIVSKSSVHSSHLSLT